jgi:stage III sporulation protein AE
LYTFTGYISITGVISGTTDAAALKATKLTISGMVPVVGGILSDASEAILVGAGFVRNTTGIYGLLAITALCIRPFLKIGAQYLLLKSTGAVSSIFGSKRCVTLIQDFTWIMGLLLAMTGTGCLMVVLSVICFMRGVG